MTGRRERQARIAVAIVWLGGLSLALRLGIGAVDPSQVLGLLCAVYLGGWGLAFFLRPNATTANAARFFAVTVALALALGLVELPALLGRVDYRDVFQTPTSPWRRHNHRPDADLIYVRDGDRRERHRFVGGELAGLNGVGPKVIYQSNVLYDAQGFRNPRVLEKADVIVVGDSFVEGLHVGDSELMTSVLARETALSVVNLGRSGDGPQQERHVVERFGLPKHPKACVWVFYEGNDLEDAAEYESNRATVANLGPVSNSRILYERSFLRNALMYARRAWLAPEKTRPASRYQGVFSSREGDVAMTFASDDHHRSTDPAKLAKALAAIREAEGLCRRDGVRLIVAFVPTKYRVYRDLCRFPAGAATWVSRPDDLPDRLASALHDVGGSATFLDLTPRFQAEAARGRLLYLPDDTHWNSAGHASAAAAIASSLNKQTSSVALPGINSAR
jgi:SGNH hydrolase-like domain, acetyltransferase AlgX